MTKINFVISFDFGTKSIGVAIGQNITYTAQPIMSLKLYNNQPDWKTIKKLFNEWKPNIVVIGLPLNTNNKEQPLTIEIKKFAKKIKNKFGIKVLLHNEIFSTVEAKSRIFLKKGYRALKKDLIDACSAVIILESWFEQQFK